MPPSSPNSIRTAFSLFELMVATTILAIIMGLLFTIFNRSSEIWINGQQTVQRQGSARLAADWITKDLSQAFCVTGNATAPAIHFFGTPTNFYFVATVPTSDQSISDMAEVGYVFDPTKGELYRYYTPPLSNFAFSALAPKWNPRNSPSPNTIPWRWPEVQDGSNYAFFAPIDALVAEGVVDFQATYSTSTWTSTSWSTTNVGIALAFVPKLPEVVDVTITTLPLKLWRPPPPLTPAAVYTSLTNRHSRTYQVTIQLNRRTM